MNFCEKKVCLTFYNVTVQSKGSSRIDGCMDVNLVDDESVRVRFGCFIMQNNQQTFNRIITSVRNETNTVFINQANKVVNLKENLEKNLLINFTKFGSAFQTINTIFNF